MHFPESEGVVFHLQKFLYEEIFECDVEPYNLQTDTLSPAQIQFMQGMFMAEEQEDSSMQLEMSNDGFEYFLHNILPENMEMWFTWGSKEGQELLSSAKEFMEELGLDCPY